MSCLTITVSGRIVAVALRANQQLAEAVAWGVHESERNSPEFLGSRGVNSELARVPPQQSTPTWHYW
ncbi:MAG: hypothetical protein FJ276_34780 [Planctomycetes bacterium]|nr:hypothetical protein [Planctomycetota bacterium]